MKGKFITVLFILFLVMFGINALAEQDILNESEIYTKLVEYYQEAEPDVVKEIELWENEDNIYYANAYCGVPGNPDGAVQLLYDLQIDAVSGLVTGTNAIVGRSIESFYLISADEDTSAVGITDWLNTNQTYDNYDLDADGEQDRICLSASDGTYLKQAVIYINDAEAYVFPEESYYAGYRIISLENGKKLIYADTESPEGYAENEMILQLDSDTNTLKQVINFADILSQYQGTHYLYYHDPFAVDGNTVTVRYISMTWTFGEIGFDFSFSWKGDTLVRDNTGNIWKERYDDEKSIMELSPEYSTAKAFDTSTEPGSAEIAYSTVAGETLSVEKYYLNNGQLYFLVKRLPGEEGWIAGLRHSDIEGMQASGSPLFSDAYYFG